MHCDLCVLKVSAVCSSSSSSSSFFFFFFFFVVVFVFILLLFFSSCMRFRFNKKIKCHPEKHQE